VARRSSSGKVILSAGEIGAFTVCEEAWRLKALDRTKPLTADSVERGRLLHHAWAKGFDEGLSLARGVRLILFLLVLASLVYLLGLQT
jgi:hypothetical protein